MTKGGRDARKSEVKTLRRRSVGRSANCEKTSLKELTGVKGKTEVARDPSALADTSTDPNFHLEDGGVFVTRDE